MIAHGSDFILAAAILAALGFAGYAASRRPLSRSRATAVATVAYGALASSAGLLITTVFHLHSFLPFTVHVHDVGESTSGLLECQLGVGCTVLAAGIVTAGVLIASLALSQAIAHRLYGKLARVSDPVRGADVQRTFGLDGVRVFVVPDRTPDVFTFAVLRWGGRRLVRAEDALAVTEGLLRTLEPDEVSLVFEHERAHIRGRDNRYLPFFHVLASVVFFDPALRAWRTRMARQHELAADEAAARRTRQPIVLARALLKIYENQRAPVVAAGILGSRRERHFVERIRRLLELDRELRVAE